MADLPFQQICNLLPACFAFQFGRIRNPGACFSRFSIRCRPSALPSCGHKHPSQARRACSWMIWPSGGGALSAAVYDWIFTLLLVLRFNRFCLFQQICNLLPLLLSWQVSNQPCSTLQSSCNLLPAAASSTSGSKNHHTALYCRQADSAAACFCGSAWLTLVFHRGYLLCSDVICNPPERRAPQLRWIIQRN